MRKQYYKHYILYIAIMSIVGLFSITKVSALGYQNNVGVSFTFEPVLAINLSSNSLVIDNLAPGNSAYSNTITVNVDTNNIAGYTLSAKVGNGTTYTNDKLTNTTSNTVFNNLSSSSNLTLAEFNDNDWGYALGTISGSTTYSGLTYNVDTVINATTNNTGTAASSGCVSTCSGTNNTDFTIAAKAAATQASGDYSNVIIFTVVGNVPPKTIGDLTYMQDFASLSASERIEVLGSMAESQSYSLMDSRDHKSYLITKLADGNVWMTQNLDHDIDSTYDYNSTNTDIPANWSDTLTSTYATGTTTWSSSDTAPESYDPGDICWNGTIRNDRNGTIANSTVACGNDKHYHIGNYYNWTAAVAMADSSSYANGNTDVNQSICPAGWMLPKSGTTLTGSGSFYYLVNQLSLTAGTSGNIQNSPVYFVYGGYWNGYSTSAGGGGIYWSSVVQDGNRAYQMSLDYNNKTIFSQSLADRKVGLSVRCIARKTT